MGNVLEFPSQQAQGLAFLDRQLRQLLADKGADEQLIDFAASRLTDIYSRINQSEQYSFRIRLPEGIDPDQVDALQVEINAGLEAVRQENHALLIELVAQLVLAEVQLFELSRR